MQSSLRRNSEDFDQTTKLVILSIPFRGQKPRKFRCVA